MKALLWFETALWVLVALYIRVIKPLQQLRRPYKIVEVREEVENTFSLILEPQGFDLPDFRSGQVAWLTVRRSPFSLRRHPFSVSSSVHNRKQLAFTIKELGDFTNTVRDLKPGETVYVDGPFGYYDILDPAHKGMVLLAGGIGIAPPMSALRSMADSKDPRPVYLFYGNNHLDHLVFGEDLKKLETRLPNFKSFVILEEPPEDWEGYSGFITQDVLEQELPDDYANLAYFVCGPLPMMSAMHKVLGRLNVPAGKVHYEEFNMA